MNENPFNFSKPAKKQDFYNRRGEVEKAIGFIRSFQCFSVIGERRIGKTSFLQHIVSREVLQEYGIEPEKYIIIHFNMGSLLEITEDMFIGTIVKRIREQTGISIESDNIFGNLEEYVERLALNGKNLIIVLDEFEITAPALDDHFSHWLRFIFQKPHVVAITGSQKTVRELGLGESASPLFNIFGNLFLGTFSRRDTENMIKKLFQKGEMKLGKEEVSFLADLSGRHPYFIQLVGYYYYEERKRIPAQNIDRARFMNRMIWQTRDQFDSYWKYLTGEEKDFLTAMSSSKRLVEFDPFVGHTLERKGFIIAENGRKKIFSLLFQEYVIRKNPKGYVEISKIEKETLAFMGRFKTGLRATALALLGFLGAILVIVFSDVIIAFLREKTQNYSEIPHLFPSAAIYLITGTLILFSVSFLILSFLVLKRFEKRIELWREINENQKEQ